MAGGFSFERSKDDHEQEGLDPQWGSRDRIQDNFPILKIPKFDIGLMKMLFCSVAIIEALVLKWTFDHVVFIVLLCF